MDIWLESCHSFPPWCNCICVYDVLTPVMLLWTSSPPAAFPHMWAQLRSVAPLKPASQISGRSKVQKQNQLGPSNQHHGAKTFIFFSQELLETNKTTQVRDGCEVRSASSSSSSATSTPAWGTAPGQGWLSNSAYSYLNFFFYLSTYKEKRHSRVIPGQGWQRMMIWQRILLYSQTEKIYIESKWPYLSFWAF